MVGLLLEGRKEEGISEPMHLHLFFNFVDYWIICFFFFFYETLIIV